MAHAAAVAASRAPWRRYVELTKPRVVALMVFTVAVGMMLAAPQGVPWRVGVFGTAGIAMLACSAAALNHLIDQRVDAVMARTRARPLPSGTLQSVQAAALAAVLGAAGTALLVVFTNNLCAVLTLASLVGYAGVYSLFLKRSTPQNIVIGGAAGAAPPLLGWVAVTGHLDAGGLVLFLIIFVWTPPHFWALAIHRRDDYARAAIPMLPVTHGVPFTAQRIRSYTVALIVISLLPVAIGMSGPLYLVGAALLGLRYLWLVHALVREPARLAWPSFRYSIVYLAGLFALLLLDRALASA